MVGRSDRSNLQAVIGVELPQRGREEARLAKTVSLESAVYSLDLVHDGGSRDERFGFRPCAAPQTGRGGAPIRVPVGHAPLLRPRRARHRGGLLLISSCDG